MKATMGTSGRCCSPSSCTPTRSNQIEIKRNRPTQIEFQPMIGTPGSCDTPNQTESCAEKSLLARSRPSPLPHSLTRTHTHTSSVNAPRYEALQHRGFCHITQRAPLRVVATRACGFRVNTSHVHFGATASGALRRTRARVADLSGSHWILQDPARPVHVYVDVFGSVWHSLEGVAADLLEEQLGLGLAREVGCVPRGLERLQEGVMHRIPFYRVDACGRDLGLGPQHPTRWHGPRQRTAFYQCHSRVSNRSDATGGHVRKCVSKEPKCDFAVADSWHTS